MPWVSEINIRVNNFVLGEAEGELKEKFQLIKRTIGGYRD